MPKLHLEISKEELEEIIAKEINKEFIDTKVTNIAFNIGQVFSDPREVNPQHKFKNCVVTLEK